MKLAYQLTTNAHEELKSIKRDLDNLTTSGKTIVEIDFEAFDSPDSMFLGLILQIHMTLKQKSIPLHLVKVGPRTQAILRNSTLDRMIDCVTQPIYAPLQGHN